MRFLKAHVTGRLKAHVTGWLKAHVTGWLMLCPAVCFAQEADAATAAGGTTLLGLACGILAIVASYFAIRLKREREARRADEARLARLEQQARQAILANQQKTRFLERMSHALRTPLNVILGFAQLQQSRLSADAPADLRLGTEATLTAGWQVLELLDDIVDIARLERGSLRLREEDCALGDVITHAIGLVKDDADTAGVNIEFEAGRQVVKADYNRLKQVMVNLLKNAIQYNQEGGWVRISVESGADGRVLCRVADNGMGITAEDRDEIFNAFARLPAGEYAHPDGAGLGLAVSRFLCEAMGAALTLDAAEGAGACFALSLEAVSAPAADLATHAEAVSPVPPTEPLTAVYVEDHRASLELMQAIMQPLQNVKLLTAGTAEDGLELIREHKPDVVLLDINLAGMDGIDAARVIKAEPELRDIPLIALSADAEEPQISAAMEAGFTEYLTKPLDIDQLWRLLAGLSRGKQAPPE